MKRLVIASLIATAILLDPSIPAQAAPPTHGVGTAVISVNGKTYTLKNGDGDIPSPPDTPCNLGHRMNVEIVDGWMYECECVVLSRGFHCSWNLVGQVATASHKKHRRLIPVLYIHPKVVG